MFENKPELIQVLETPTLIEPPAKKTRKPRKPMSEDQKEVLRERLKLARESKKNKRDASIKVEPVVEPVVVQVAEPVKEHVVLDIEDNALGGHSAPEPVKKVRKPRAKKVVEQPLDDSMELRKQLDELRASNKSQERELLKSQLANQKLKKESMAKPASPVMEEPKGPGFPELPLDFNAPKKRYSTYKKSVWADMV